VRVTESDQTSLLTTKRSTEIVVGGGGEIKYKTSPCKKKSTEKKNKETSKNGW